MNIFTFLISVAAIGTVLAWLTIALTLIVNLIKTISNKNMGYIFLTVGLLYLSIPIIVLFSKGHAGSFWWWLFAIIAGSSAIINFMIFDDSLERNRCHICNSWGLRNKTLTDSSYKRDGETTSSSRMSGDGKAKVITYTHTDRGIKEDKIYRQVLMCHCEKCGAYYEIWKQGGKSGSNRPVEITKDRYEKSKEKYLFSNILPGHKRRTKRSCGEKFLYLYGNDDNDRDIFPDEE